VFRTDGQSDQYRAFATMWRVPDNLLHVFFLTLMHALEVITRACGSYQDFLDRGLPLTRKLLNHDLVDRFVISVSQMTKDMFHLS
jgi:hypothetical protein